MHGQPHKQLRRAALWKDKLPVEIGSAAIRCAAVRLFAASRACLPGAVGD